MTKSFESEQVASRNEAANILRDMADGVAGGVVRLSSDDESVDVAVPEEVGVELEFEGEDGEMSIEVELEWPDSSDPKEESVESIEEMSSEGAELAVGRERCRTVSLGSRCFRTALRSGAGGWSTETGT